MLCQNCGKRTAEVQYTELVGGQKHSEWLCPRCAAERGILITEPAGPPPGVEPVSRESSKVKIRCPSCGMDWATFQRDGKLGCAQCYETFRDELDPVLRRLHRSSEHRPPKEELDALARLRRVLRALRLELNEAVRREDFELAARLRDEIRRYQAEAEALSKVRAEDDSRDGEEAS